MIAESANADLTDAGLSYLYRPSLLGRPLEFRLLADALEWRIGERSGRVPYAAIRRVRLSYRPVALQSHRFFAEIWSDAAPKLQLASTSMRGLAEVERNDDAYSAFVGELHRRIARAGGTPILDTGKNPVLYWIGCALFAATALVMAVLAVYGLLEGSLAGAAFIGGFLALFLWQVGRFFLRNRPRRYTADTLPPDLLPRSGG